LLGHASFSFVIPAKGGIQGPHDQHFAARPWIRLSPG
jgi:hypothetical protein